MSRPEGPVIAVIVRDLLDARAVYLGGVITEDKSNEIPAARQLLGRLDLGGKIVL